MMERGPKIIIAADELTREPEPTPAPPPQRERLVLLPVPVPAVPAAGVAAKATEGAAPVRATPALLRPVLVSLVPFWNAWYWARVARRLPESAFVAWPMAIFLGSVSLALAVFLALCLRGQHRDRPERPAERPSVAPGAERLEQAVDPTSPGPREEKLDRSTERPSPLSPGDWLERLADRLGTSVVVVRTERGSGTGFVVASEGDRHLLLTNRHVLAKGPKRGEAVRLAAPCRILLRSGAEHAASVVGLPDREDLDLALLEAQVPGLAPLGPVADFADVRQGERVAAVGHPLGLNFTLTDGIVSAKRDELLIQTTAPINRGNSGGPLVNAHHKVLGVCTLLIDPDAGQAVGMALRADSIREPQHWRLRDSEVERLLRAIPR
jgi:S1-C subfamily serine protease